MTIVDHYSVIIGGYHYSGANPRKEPVRDSFSIGLTLQADQRQLSFWYLAGQIRRGKDQPFHAFNLCCLHSASAVTAEALAFEKTLATEMSSV